jgi:hypothetical protein
MLISYQHGRAAPPRALAVVGSPHDEDEVVSVARSEEEPA